MPGSMSPPDFNAEKAAGIYQYDIEKVIKKLKIIDDSAKVKISESLIDYNNKMYELSALHSATFQKLEADFDRNVQIAMRNRDRNQMNGVKAEIQRIIPPIRMIRPVRINSPTNTLRRFGDSIIFSLRSYNLKIP